jgi:hypothetical protein
VADEYCTPAQVKGAHGVNPSDPSFDVVIPDFIQRASRAIDTWCDRRFGKDAGASSRLFDVGGHSRQVPIGDLSAAPTAVTVLDESGATVSTLVVASDLVMLPLVRREDEPITMLRFRPSAAGSLTAGAQISVTGVWGFPQVPLDVVEATIETVREWLRFTQGVTVLAPPVDDGEGLGRSRSLPMKARNLLAGYRRIAVV